jgi:hypothetical protein
MTLASSVPVHVDSDGRIATDVVCLNCGYNLRSCLIGGACPECGMAVRVSLRGDRLASAPPGYLRQLQQGAAWFHVGVVMALPLLFFGLAPAAVGVWMLTAGESGRAEPTRDARFRWATRLLMVTGALILVGLSAAAVAMFAWQRTLFLQLRVELQAMDVLFIVGSGLLWMGLIALSVHLEALAERAGSEAMRRKCAWFRKHWLAGLGAMVILALGVQVSNWVYVARGVYWMWASAVFGALVAGVLVWLWVVSLRFAGALRRFFALAGGGVAGA